MRSLTTLLSVAAIASSLLEVSTARADEVRPPESVTVVTTGPRVYRRRPGPRFMFPLKIDLGYAGADTTRGWAPGVAAAVGIHWASLSPEPTNFDVGVGVFGALLGAPVTSDAMAMDAPMDNNIAYGGVYLEGAHTLSHGNFWRTWASGRGEYLESSVFGEERTGFGVSGRLSAELYASGVGIAPSGLFLGTYAVGVYVEAGARQMAANMSDFQISAGLTFRTPFVIAP